MLPTTHRDQSRHHQARGLGVPPYLSRALRQAPVLSHEEETATALAAWHAREEAWGLVLGDATAHAAAVLAALDAARAEGDSEVSKSTAAARRVLLDAISTGDASLIARADKDDVVLRAVVGHMPAALAAKASVALGRLDRAIGKMERHNLTFILHLIRARFQGWLGCGEFELGDLLGFGTLGLHVAAMRFDPARGCKFTTFAQHWVAHAIRREIQDTRYRVRLPIHIQDKIGVVVRTRDALLGAGEAATAEAIAAKLGTLSAAQVAAVLAARDVNMGPSLHARVRGVDGDDAQEFGDFVGDPSAESEDDLAGAMDEGHRAEVLYDAMRDLGPVERYVVERRAGLGGCEPAILAEVGDSLGLSRQRVQQIEKSSMKVLRRSVEARMR